MPSTSSNLKTDRDPTFVVFTLDRPIRGLQTCHEQYNCAIEHASNMNYCALAVDKHVPATQGYSSFPPLPLHCPGYFKIFLKLGLRRIYLWIFYLVLACIFTERISTRPGAAAFNALYSSLLVIVALLMLSCVSVSFFFIMSRRSISFKFTFLQHLICFIYFKFELMTSFNSLHM